MTDLVARLAARAVGAGPGRAVPRPVPRFSGADRDVLEDEDTGVVPVGVAATDHGPAGGWERRDEPSVAGAAERRPITRTGRGADPDRPTPTSVQVVTTRDATTDPGRPPTTGATRRRRDRDQVPVAARPGPAERAAGPDPVARAGPPGEPDPGPDTAPRDGPPTGSGHPDVPDVRSTPVVARPVRGRGPSPGVDGAAGGPTIRVHIGRLEVRAAPAPPSPRPRSDPPGPDTSLAEYLRGHRGGR